MISRGHDLKEQVRFRFVFRRYYRDRIETGEETKEMECEKTLKLFLSWFNLQKNRGKLYRGVVTFVNSGERWLWSPSCGWRFVGVRGHRLPVQLPLF